MRIPLVRAFVLNNRSLQRKGTGVGKVPILLGGQSSGKPVRVDFMVPEDSCLRGQGTGGVPAALGVIIGKTKVSLQKHK